MLVTRAAEQADELCSLLVDAGFHAEAVPVMRLDPLLSTAQLDRLAAATPEYDVVVFTSANAASMLLSRAGPPAATIAFAIGPGTAAAARRHGWSVRPLPEQFVAESLAELISSEDLTGRRVLLPRAAGARPLLPERLRQLGARVDVVELYRMVPEQGSAPKLRQALADPRLDWVTFTSGSTVECFLSVAGEYGAGGTWRSVCIGPVTAETARSRGLRVDLVARPHSLGGLVRALVDFRLSENGRRP